MIQIMAVAEITEEESKRLVSFSHLLPEFL
jgi:hypothetical protein